MSMCCWVTTSGPMLDSYRYLRPNAMKKTSTGKQVLQKRSRMRGVREEKWKKIFLSCRVPGWQLKIGNKNFSIGKIYKKGAVDKWWEIPCNARERSEQNSHSNLLPSSPSRFHFFSTIFKLSFFRRNSEMPLRMHPDRNPVWKWKGKKWKVPNPTHNSLSFQGIFRG